MRYDLGYVSNAFPGFITRLINSMMNSLFLFLLIFKNTLEDPTTSSQTFSSNAFCERIDESRMQGIKEILLRFTSVTITTEGIVVIGMAVLKAGL